MVVEIRRNLRPLNLYRKSISFDVSRRGNYRGCDCDCLRGLADARDSRDDKHPDN